MHTFVYSKVERVVERVAAERVAAEKVVARVEAERVVARVAAERVVAKVAARVEAVSVAEGTVAAEKAEGTVAGRRVDVDLVGGFALPWNRQWGSKARASTMREEGPLSKLPPPQLPRPLLQTREAVCTSSRMRALHI